MRLLPGSIRSVAVLVGVVSACGDSGPVEPAQTTHAPTLSLAEVSPSSAVAGSCDLAVTLNGQGFRHSIFSSLVAWTVNGTRTMLETRFVDSTKLTASVPAALLANPGGADVSVRTVDRIEGTVTATSNHLPFTISAPPFSISLSPRSTTSGSHDLSVTVQGSGFRGAGHNTSTAEWCANGLLVPLPTTFVSAEQLTAHIPAELVSEPGQASVFVLTGDAMGDVPLAQSGAATFTVSSN